MSERRELTAIVPGFVLLLKHCFFFRYQWYSACSDLSSIYIRNYEVRFLFSRLMIFLKEIAHREVQVNRVVKTKRSVWEVFHFQITKGRFLSALKIM